VEEAEGGRGFQSGMLSSWARESWVRKRLGRRLGRRRGRRERMVDMGYGRIGGGRAEGRTRNVEWRGWRG